MTKAISKFAFSTPIFGLACLERDNGSCVIVYVGGGGSSKTGIGNRLEVAELEAENRLSVLATLDTGTELGTALSADGRLIAACFGAQLRLFRCECLKPMPVIEPLATVTADFEEKDASLNCCCLMNSVVATGGEDGCLRLWRTDGSKLFDCGGDDKHDEAITSVDFAPSGHVVCSSSKDNTCRLWSVATGRLLCVLDVAPLCPPPPVGGGKKKRGLPPPKLNCRACCFADDATLFSVASFTRGPAYAHKWTLDVDQELGGKPVATARASALPVSAAAIGPRKATLALGDVDGILRVLDLNFAEVARAKLHDLPITAISSGPDSTSALIANSLFSASADNKLGSIVLPDATQPGCPFCFLALLVALAAILLVALQPDIFHEQPYTHR